MTFGLLKQQTLPYVPGCASKRMPAGWGPCSTKGKKEGRKEGRKRAISAGNSSKQGAANSTTTEAVIGVLKSQKRQKTEKKPKVQKNADEVPSIGHYFVLAWKGEEAVIVDPLCTTTANKCADTLQRRGFTVIRPHLWKRWKGDHIMCGL